MQTTGVVLVLLAGVAVGQNQSIFDGTCSSVIYCNNKILELVEASEFFKDPKDFVDMWIVEDPTMALVSFNEKVYSKASKGLDYKKELKEWLQLFFRNTDRAYVSVLPTDWPETPPHLHKIADPALKSWAKHLNLMWTGLVKKTRADSYIFPERFSLLYMPNPVVISGGRYREWYYWDSFWILIGLLRTGMTTTAKGMLENFVALIEEFGLVPNGGRTYYTKRSQPPFLIPMVKLYMDHMEELKRRDPNVTSPSFAFDYITALEDEFQFWVKRRSVNVSVNGENVTMFAYGTNSTGPRPEEMSDDLNVSSNLKGRVKEEFFVDIKTTCESGWDFSSRWAVGPDGKPANSPTIPWSRLKPRQILPVDLNALMCYNARILGYIHAKLADNNEDDPEAQKYFQLSEKISDGIMKLMYDKETGSWYDYDFINKRQRKNFYASNAWPLWMDCIGTGTNKTELGLQFLSYLEKENVTTYPGGLPASKFENTGFAWDHPHGYAPLVHSMVTALSSVDHPKTKAAAFGFAQKWVDMSYSAYVKSQSMFHSYNVTDIHHEGEGEDGYAWSVGVAIDFLVKYGDKLKAPVSSAYRRGEVTVVLSLTVVLVCKRFL